MLRELAGSRVSKYLRSSGNFLVATLRPLESGWELYLKAGSDRVPVASVSTAFLSSPSCASHVALDGSISHGRGNWMMRMVLDKPLPVLESH